MHGGGGEPWGALTSRASGPTGTVASTAQAPGCVMGPLTHVPFSGHGDPTAGFTRARFSPAEAMRKEAAVLLLTSGEPDCVPSNVFSKPCL